MKGKTGIRFRRKGALELLEAQLVKGTKPEKIDGRTSDKNIPLSEIDIKRIKKEIETLRMSVSKQY